MLKAPFPWFGGKSRVADIVWDRFGDVANYVEPFFGSGAVLLHPAPRSRKRSRCGFLFDKSCQSLLLTAHA
jgi:site-specific DNA-adenine methylase